MFTSIQDHEAKRPVTPAVAYSNGGHAPGLGLGTDLAVAWSARQGTLSSDRSVCALDEDAGSLPGWKNRIVPGLRLGHGAPTQDSLFVQLDRKPRRPAPG